MPNEVNIYTPRYLAEVVRLAPPVYTFFRDTFFTNVHVFPTKAIDFDLVKGRPPHGCIRPSAQWRKGAEFCRLRDPELQAAPHQSL